MCAITEIQINGQNIIRDTCQGQTDTVNDLLTKFRQLENRQKELEEELREVKVNSKELEDELVQIKNNG